MGQHARRDTPLAVYFSQAQELCRAAIEGRKENVEPAIIGVTTVK
jgi:hypothetical protein